MAFFFFFMNAREYLRCSLLTRLLHRSLSKREGRSRHSGKAVSLISLPPCLRKRCETVLLLPKIAYSTLQARVQIGKLAAPHQGAANHVLRQLATHGKLAFFLSQKEKAAHLEHSDEASPRGPSRRVYIRGTTFFHHTSHFRAETSPFSCT